MARQSFEVDIQLQYQKAIEDFTKALRDAAQNITVALQVSQGDFAAIRAEGERFFQSTEGAINILNRNSPISRKDMQEYCAKMIKEIERQIAQNPQAGEALRGVLAGFKAQLSQWEGTLDIDFNVARPATDEFDDACDELQRGIGQVYQAWEEFDNRVKRSTGATTVRKQVEDALSAARQNITGLQSTLSELHNAIEQIPQGRAGDAARAELQAQAQRIAQQIAELEQREQDLARRKQDIDSNQNLSAADRDTAYDRLKGQVTQLKTNTEEVKKYGEAVSGAVDNFGKKSSVIAEMKERTDHLTQTMRDLHMAGIKIPDTVTKIAGIMSQFAIGAEFASKKMGELTDYFVNAPSRVRDLGRVFHDVGVSSEQMVTDAEGNVRKLVDVVTEGAQKAEASLDEKMETYQRMRERRGLGRLTGAEEQRYRSRLYSSSVQRYVEQAAAGSDEGTRHGASSVARIVGGMGTQGLTRGLRGGVTNLVSGLGRTFMRLIGPVGRRIVAAISPFITKTLGFVAKIFSGWGGWALMAIDIIKSIGGIFLKHYQTYMKQAAELTKKSITLTSGLQITAIQHASQLRIAGLQQALELDKKRLEMNRELMMSVAEMNAADLASRSKILELEQQRLAAQKQGEMFVKKAGQVSEIAQKYNEYSESMDEGRGTAKRNKGWLRTIAGIGSLGLTEIIHSAAQKVGWASNDRFLDEQGNVVDASISNSAAKKYWFKSSQDVAIGSMLESANAARKVMKEQYNAEFNQMIEEYQNFANIISESQVGEYSKEMAEKLQAIQKENEAVLEDMAKNQDKFAAAMAFQKGFDASLESGAIQKNKWTGDYMFTNASGQRVALGSTEEEARASFENQKMLNGSVNREYEAMLEVQKQVQARTKAIEAEAKIEQDINYLQQEMVKKQEEQKKEFRDQLQSNLLNSVSDAFNVQLGSDFTTSMQKLTLGITQQSALDDPRFRRGRNGFSADDKQRLQMQQAVEKTYLDKQAEYEKGLEKELTDVRIKNENAVYQMQLDHTVAFAAVLEEGATNFLQASIENRKAYRELSYRGMDRQLQAEILQADTYGKTKMQIQMEMELLRIEQKYDKAQTELENSIRSRRAELTQTQRERDTKEMNTLKEEQQAEMNRMDEEQVNRKWELEKAMMDAQHALALKNIDQIRLAIIGYIKDIITINVFMKPFAIGPLVKSKKNISQTIDSESMRGYNDYVHVSSSAHFYGYMSRFIQRGVYNPTFPLSTSQLAPVANHDKYHLIGPAIRWLKTHTGHSHICPSIRKFTSPNDASKIRIVRKPDTYGLWKIHLVTV